MTFKEEQNLFKTKASLLLCLLLVTPLVLYFSGIPTKTIITSLIITAAIFAVSCVFLMSVRLLVSVQASGISFQVKGLQRKETTFLWDDIRSIQKVSIKPLSEFGGWGVRYKRSKTGYIFEGESAVELTTNNNQVIVITIKNREAFLASVATFKSL